jgi:hypothetical protein
VPSRLIIFNSSRNEKNGTARSPSLPRAVFADANQIITANWPLDFTLDTYGRCWHGEMLHWKERLLIDL